MILSDDSLTIAIAAVLGLLPVMPVRRVVKAKPSAPRASLKATGGMMRRRKFLSIFATRMLKILEKRFEI
jgi:hypothetical protein